MIHVRGVKTHYWYTAVLHVVAETWRLLSCMCVRVKNATSKMTKKDILKFENIIMKNQIHFTMQALCQVPDHLEIIHGEFSKAVVKTVCWQTVLIVIILCWHFVPCNLSISPLLLAIGVQCFLYNLSWYLQYCAFGSVTNYVTHCCSILTVRNYLWHV